MTGVAVGRKCRNISRSEGHARNESSDSDKAIMDASSRLLLTTFSIPESFLREPEHLPCAFGLRKRTNLIRIKQ